MNLTSQSLKSRRRAPALLLPTAFVLALTFILFARLQPTALAASVFVVNSTGDSADSNTADGVCDDGTGHCTFRAAIQQSNATAGKDTINFNIPGSGVQTIKPATALPLIGDAVIINGYSQPGAKENTQAVGSDAILLIELSGVTNSSGGLTISGGGTTVRGLVINGFFTTDITIERNGGNVIEGCYIGTDATGTVRGGNNTFYGIEISLSDGNTIGGLTPAARNVISGNTFRGIYIRSSNNLVQGNFIGTDATGKASVVASAGSGQQGILIEGSFPKASTNNVIGGTAAGARNVISGNGKEGIFIASPGNIVQGNFIGTDVTGKVGLRNGLGTSGIKTISPNTLIGGIESGAGNLISGNAGSGVEISGVGSKLQGNLIGTDITGTSSLGNGRFGVEADIGAIIGGTEPGARNVISASRFGENVRLSPVGGSPAGTVTVQGNYIGTDISGTLALDNSSDGIFVNSPNNLIGGLTPAARNVISGHPRHAVFIFSSSGNIVRGNFIGTDATGAAPLSNAGDGIFIAFGARDSIIGGAVGGSGNVIAFNGGNGITVSPEGVFGGVFPTGNSVRGNAVFSNGLLGIDLIVPLEPNQDLPIMRDGMTPNDAGDPDTGPNVLQNAPVVLSTDTNGGTMTAQGTLNSKPDASFTIDLYANSTCDASGSGEGHAFVGTTSATTDANGNATFNMSFAAPAAGQVITATATDAAGNTSEFSVCNVGSAPGSVQFTSTTYAAAEQSGAVTAVVTRTLGTVSAATVDFAATDGTARAGEDYTAVSGTLSFAPGETTRTFNVPITNDTLEEEAETFNLTLSNPTGGVSLGPQSAATVNISDNDEPLISFFGNDVRVVEGNSGTTEAVFTVALSAASFRIVTVEFRTFERSANSLDFQSVMGTLVFNPGETTKTISVPINGDTTPERDEDFSISLSRPTNASFATSDFSISSLGIIWDDDSPGIHFSAPNFNVNERDGSATITVVRRGNASASANVDYRTNSNAATLQNNFVASPRADYTPAFGHLFFAPGETEKSFTILVNDDAYVENPETISIVLSKATDAVSGTTYEAILTINSDDTQPPTPANNPLDDAQFFVRQHYHDLLNREPDASGLQFWTSEIEGCGADQPCRQARRTGVSAAFFLSIEFQKTGYQVFRIYKTSFANSATRPRGLPTFLEFLRDTQEVGRGVAVGQGNWEQQLQQNALSFARAWVGSAEFRAAAGFSEATSAADYADKLFANSGVIPTGEEFADAIAAYGSGGTDGRAAALLSIVNSGSVYNKQYNPAFVYMQYVGYLRRAPNEQPNNDFSGFDFWLAKLDSFTQAGEDVRDEQVALSRMQRAEMVRSFVESTEYRQRFGQP
jgi:hypothetical protein